MGERGGGMESWSAGEGGWPEGSERRGLETHTPPGTLDSSATEGMGAMLARFLCPSPGTGGG